MALRGRSADIVLIKRCSIDAYVTALSRHDLAEIEQDSLYNLATRCETGVQRVPLARQLSISTTMLSDPAIAADDTERLWPMMTRTFLETGVAANCAICLEMPRHQAGEYLRAGRSKIEGRVCRDWIADSSDGRGVVRQPSETTSIPSNAPLSGLSCISESPESPTVAVRT
ncbi:hypothetical protein BD414DRAFT_510003 [Trametes punicea]|nr:hypothetical protein BD414DRAFT_510003 [Trametes punicea]